MSLLYFQFFLAFIFNFYVLYLFEIKHIEKFISCSFIMLSVKLQSYVTSSTMIFAELKNLVLEK